MNIERVKELMVIEPYKSLYDRGKGYEKEWARRDIWFVYCMTSMGMDNPYRNLNMMTRYDDIFFDIYPKGWKKHDSVVDGAIERARFMGKSVEDRLLESSIHAAEQLAEYFGGVNFLDRTVNGQYMYDPGAVLSQLKQVGGVLVSLKSLRDEHSKASGGGRVRGGEDKGDYED